MESLLHWSIANSDPNAPPPSTDIWKLDPGIIDAILGRPDSELMEEALAVAMDGSKDDDERVKALDNLEMLIQQIDNSNNLERLKMWGPLHGLLTSSTTPDPVLHQTLWVIGTALQNNPAAQDSYLTYNPISTLTRLLALSSSPSSRIRLKALYALSGLLRHNRPAVEKLEDEAGWERLGEALRDPCIRVRRRTIGLLNFLLYCSLSFATTATTAAEEYFRPSQPLHANSHAANLADPKRMDTSSIAVEAVKRHGIVGDVVKALTNPLPHGADGDNVDPDEDFEDYGVMFLYTYLIDCDGHLEESDRDNFRAWLTKEEEKVWGLDETERTKLVKKVTQIN